MKKKLVVALISAAMVTSMLGACGSSNASSSSASSTATSSVSASSASEEDTTAASSSVSASSASEEVSADADQEAADKVAALIDAIYVQERNDNTDEQCKEAKEAWDALTDAQGFRFSFTPLPGSFSPFLHSTMRYLSLIHISEPTRLALLSRMPSSA